jgi:7 transmembrane helices usually fused to an inactive transglutaminase/Inactive transglutaminase fused to 7 transmembrane helices
MSSKFRLILAVILLCALGIGLATYKNRKLGVPLWVGEESTSWLVEAKVSFLLAEEKPVTVRLALPAAASDESIGQEAGSLDFGYSPEVTQSGLKAVWSARQPSLGTHALYYRVRFPERFKTGGGGEEVKGPPPIAESPGLTGSVEKAAQELIESSRAVSADTDTFFTHLLLQISKENSAQELLLLRRHYETVENVKEEKLLITMAIDLLKMAGIPARLAHGIRLDADAGPQSAMPLIEYCDGATWKVKNPLQPNVSLRSDNIFVWNRGGSSLLEVFGGENSKVVFTVVKDLISLERMNSLRDSRFMLSTILALPVSERAVFRYVVLIPLGAFVVVILRNIVGVPTLGTFMPVLLALAFLEMDLGLGIIMFASIVAVGLYFRFLLSSMNLLVVPRVAACVVIVTLLMLVMSLISWELGIRGVLQITLFPMIIIAWTIERMSLIWEEEGKRNAILQVAGSVVVAVVAYLVMKVPQIQYWAQYFPELLLVLLAAILLIGRYTGYRLSELHRFRNFTEA